LILDKGNRVGCWDEGRSRLDGRLHGAPRVNLHVLALLSGPSLAAVALKCGKWAMGSNRNKGDGENGAFSMMLAGIRVTGILGT